MTTYRSPVYSYGFIDVPGVVASNNFISIFNPSSSKVRHIPLEVGLTCYTTTNVAVVGSLAAYPISAASAGTLVTNSTDVNKYSTNAPTPSVEIRVGNPTVTRINNTPMTFKAPVVATGGGNSGTITAVAPVQYTLTFPPGTGVVFNTAQGDVGQRWCLVYAWAEQTI